MFTKKKFILSSLIGLDYITNQNIIFKKSQCEKDNLNKLTNLYSSHVKALKYKNDNKLNCTDINNIIENKKDQKIKKMIDVNTKISEIINVIFLDEKK